ncbi:THUMP-like domain-containing protein [uncultured Corynebacterium sp.]|uniref:THUMP-like domain-containing protein n=1 Tax=uncultured Corynebacterium sp. TaxID=159447 RepID=UPI0025D42285|nr:SAM-dependent methyltransferase [uncultured Corynebacterium sp.]
MSLSLDEVRALTADPGLANAAADLPLSDATLVRDLAHLKSAVGDMARAVVELERARRSVVGKLPAGWFLDSDSAQQATHAAVARRRANRLAAAVADGVAPGVHDVTCSVGAELAPLTEIGGFPVLGSDLDPARAAMARANVPGAMIAVADALAPVSDGMIVVADPARRAGGRRIPRPEDLLPPLPDLIDAWRGGGTRHEMAVKCAPGIDYSEWEGEAAVTSVDGGVKEVCLYTPGLATGPADRPVRRSTHILRTREPGTRAEVYDDSMDDDCGVGDAGKYVIDPDGAVVRAGLVRHYAAAHGLRQLDERIAHVTGDEIPPGASGFEVLEQVPLKKVRRALAERDCSRVEILVRGVDVNPDALRKQWKLKGGGGSGGAGAALGVVITRIGSAATAFVCGPRRWGPEFEGPGAPDVRL